MVEIKSSRLLPFMFMSLFIIVILKNNVFFFTVDVEFMLYDKNQPFNYV